MPDIPVIWEGDSMAVTSSALSTALTALGVTEIAAAAHQGAVTAETSLTGSASTDTIAVSPANVAYTQADQTTIADLANSLKTHVNANTVDISNIFTAVAALITAVNALNTALQTAHVES